MKDRNQLPCVSFILFLLIFFSPLVCLAAESASSFKLVQDAIQESMAQLGVNKGDTGILLLTNAYYGRIDGKSAEPYRDLLSDITGCTSGKRSLLDVHTPFKESLWFALFSKKSNKLVFYRCQDSSLETQTIDATPDTLLRVKAWKRASEGAMGPKNLFQVVSIALAWSAGTEWSILKVAGFHDQLAPGINIGYLFHRYIEKKVPAETGDECVFFGALPKCYMDTLQMVYDATLGKQQNYGVSMSREQLSKYKTKGAMPCVVAVRLNRGKDSCSGVVLGFSRKQVMDDLGVREADLNPKGGEGNPVFCIARIKACMQMAKIEPEQQMKWVVEMHRFAGNAKLVNKICNAGGDPYAIVWALK